MLRVAHAWLLAMTLLRLPLTPRLAGGQSATRFICSSLLAQAFVLVCYAIAADHRYVTPGDFESAAVFDAIRSS